MATDITFDFTGRAVFVTGGSNGIGLAIAQAFGEAGASVTISGTRASAGEYDGDLSRFTYTQLLMQDADQVESVIGSQLNLDVLVNCAGTVLRGREYEPDGFARIIRINLLGTQQASVAAHPLLKKSRGSIINIASMSSYFGFPRVPAYGASKTAVVSLTKSLASAWAEDGIRVNAIAPGFIITNLTRSVQENPELRDRILERTPMARFGDPAEIAGAALFLSSGRAGFITGVTIPVDGGFAAQGV